MRHEHDNRRIHARKNLHAALVITADSRVAAGLDPGRRAANTTELLQAMPQYEGARMRHEIGFIDRQHAAEESQVAKFPEVRKRCVEFVVDADSKRGMPLVHAEEYRFL